MAKRGDTARAEVYEKITTAFGDDFVGVVDKKIYVTANEDGEKIQFAITITMPKNQITKTNFDFSDNETKKVESFETNVEISDKEKEDIKKLMQELNL